MGIANTVSKEVYGWGSLAVVIVLMSVVLLKFKSNNVANITCASGYTFNETANNCYLTTNASVTSAVGSVASTLDTFVTALSEPQNWVVIVIIALIGFGVLAYFRRNKNA